MSLDGTWNVKLNTPMGARDATVELTTNGSILSGKWAGPQGAQEFSGGTVEGNTLAWQVQMQGPMGAMSLQFEGAVDGDQISGTVRFGSFGSGSFTGTRA